MIRAIAHSECKANIANCKWIAASYNCIAHTTCKSNSKINNCIAQSACKGNCSFLQIIEDKQSRCISLKANCSAMKWKNFRIASCCIALYFSELCYMDQGCIEGNQGLCYSFLVTVCYRLLCYSFLGRVGSAITRLVALYKAAIARCTKQLWKLAKECCAPLSSVGSNTSLDWIPI